MKMVKTQKGGNYNLGIAPTVPARCYSTFNESSKYICPRTPMDNRVTNIQALEHALKLESTGSQSGGNFCLDKGIQLGLNHACAPNDQPTVSELAFDSRYEYGASTFNWNGKGGDKNHTRHAANLLEELDKKIRQNTMKSEEAIAKLVDTYTGPGFRYNGKGKSEYIKVLKAFHKAFPNAERQTTSYDLGGGEVKVFTLTRGKMIANFNKKKATNKIESLGCVCNVKVDVRKKYVKSIKCTFEFLSKDELTALNKLQVFQKGGNSYYLEDRQQAIAGQAQVGSDNSKARSCKKKQTGGSQASDFCGDTSLRQFGCKQPIWQPNCN